MARRPRVCHRPTVPSCTGSWRYTLAVHRWDHMPSRRWWRHCHFAPASIGLTGSVRRSPRSASRSSPPDASTRFRWRSISMPCQKSDKLNKGQSQTQRCLRVSHQGADLVHQRLFTRLADEADCHAFALNQIVRHAANRSTGQSRLCLPAPGCMTAIRGGSPSVLLTVLKTSHRTSSSASKRTSGGR